MFLVMGGHQSSRLHLMDRIQRQIGLLEEILLLGDKRL
jgi:hypothetical protein